VGILDHLKQHAVRGDQARLAFDDHGEAGNILGAGRQFAVDQLQFPGVDVKLGGRQIFRGQAFADRNGKASADQRGRRDHDPPLPQQADHLHHAETRGGAVARRAILWLGRIYRLVIDKHGPQLPFEPPHASAEGLLFGLRQARAVSTRNKRNREN
jgi:hypothetical protein